MNSPLPVAEALYRAHKQLATGTLRVARGGRESRLLMHDGDVVGAELGWGHRTAVQALLLAGKLDYGSLDALWARGEAGVPDDETLDLAEVDARGLGDLQLLANLRSVTSSGEEAVWVPGPVDGARARLAGVLAVRAAFEPAADRAAAYRCADVDACEAWLLGDADRAFLAQFADFAPVPEGATAAQVALLRLLALEGLVETLDQDALQTRRLSQDVEDAWRAEAARAEEEGRAEQERAEAEAARAAQAQRLADEEQAAEAQRLAEAQRAAEAEAAEEARLLEAQRLAAEARRAEESRQRDEERRAREAYEARLAEEERKAREAYEARLAEEERAAQASPASVEAMPFEIPAEETFEAELSEEPASEPEPAAMELEPAAMELEPAAMEPPPSATEPPVIEATPDWLTADTSAEAEQMRAARERAQAQVQRDLQEALRRSASGDADAWLEEPAAAPFHFTEPNEAVLELTAEDQQPETIELSSAEIASGGSDWGAAVPDAAIPYPAPPTDDDSWAVGPEPTASAPESPRQGEDRDLWRIVQFDKGGVDSLSSSFEEALGKVDAHLEQLVGFPATSTWPAPEESLPEVSIESLAAGTLPPFGVEGDNGFDPNDTDLSLEELEALFPLSEEELADEPADPIEASKLRRQRLLKRAMENLGVLPRPGGAPSGAVAVTPAEAAPASASPRSVDEAQLARAIDHRFQQIKSRADHFTLLGLPRDAGKDQVKNAFLSLAKVFHPDRLPPALAALSSQMSTVFEGIREAYEVLYDDAKRKAYVLSLDRPAKIEANKRPDEAAELFKRGEVYFKKREFRSADEHFTRAHGIDPKPAYLAARAWAIYMDPARKAELATVKQYLNDALKADPSCDRAHYQLGVIARVEGDADKAERYFREAVRSNPRHLEANQELRLIEMRRKNGPGKKGLFR